MGLGVAHRSSRGNFLLLSVLLGPISRLVYFLLSFPEKATDGGLQAEDWTLNMEICDIINETEEG